MTEGTACRLSPLPGFLESIPLGEYRHYTGLIDDVRKVAGLTKDKVMVQINKHCLFEGNEPIPTRTVVRNLHAGPCKDLLIKLISYHINRSTHAAGTVQSDIHN